MTLQGTLVSSLEATTGSHLGALSGIEITLCEGGAFRGALNLPWEMTYNALTASGMEIEAKNMSINLSVVIFGFMLDCLYSGNVPMLMAITSTLTGLIRILSNRLAKGGLSSSSCPPSVSMSGSYGLSPQQTVTLTP